MTDDLVIGDERAFEKAYRASLDKRSRKAIAIGVSANARWTGTGTSRTPPVPNGGLVGRVALASAPDGLGGRRDFYIGETHASLDGVEVFSWAAPVACTFYRGSSHHAWCSDVAAVRSFRHRGDSITQVADDLLREGSPTDFFPSRAFSAPAAPASSAARQLPRALPGTTRPRPLPNAQATPNASAPALRAEELLRSALAAPREDRLSPVLSTLQPDQYDLVTEPARGTVIIEGNPGTGKTIIATHRAAWLIDRNRFEPDPTFDDSVDGDVLVIGPTEGYSSHVSTVIRRLTNSSSRVRIMSLPRLLSALSGLESTPTGPESTTWQDADPELARLAFRAAEETVARRRRASIEDAYQRLRTNKSGRGEALTNDDEWSWYLEGLPPFQDTRTERRLRPLIASLGAVIRPPQELLNIGHVIVDEAQDVHGAEWELLRRLNPSGHWTLIGDLNQRRSDYTASSWAQILDLISADAATPIRRLERGYRSTRPILTFANRLLPEENRRLLAFQETGPEPVVIGVKNIELTSTALEQVSRLHAAYPNGTVAVIDTEPRWVREELRRANWRAVGGNPTSWELGERVVRVLPPDEARGLEFDAVVVIEPVSFPRNMVVQEGPLYTALTRANRELVVLHAKPLPEELAVPPRALNPAPQEPTVPQPGPQSPAARDSVSETRPRPAMAAQSTRRTLPTRPEFRSPKPEARRSPKATPQPSKSVPKFEAPPRPLGGSAPGAARPQASKSLAPAAATRRSCPVCKAPVLDPNATVVPAHNARIAERVVPCVGEGRRLPVNSPGGAVQRSPMKPPAKKQSSPSRSPAQPPSGAPSKAVYRACPDCGWDAGTANRVPIHYVEAGRTARKCAGSGRAPRPRPTLAQSSSVAARASGPAHKVCSRCGRPMPDGKALGHRDRNTGQPCYGSPR